MSSARSITAAVNPTRAVYLDYPLGHTAGKVNDPDDQMNIMRDTLNAFVDITVPGTIIDLAYSWRDDDSWKDKVMRPQTSERPSSNSKHNDDRVQRFDTPQYQSTADADAADPDCPSCIFLESN